MYLYVGECTHRRKGSDSHKLRNGGGDVVVLPRQRADDVEDDVDDDFGMDGTIVVATAEGGDLLPGINMTLQWLAPLQFIAALWVIVSAMMLAYHLLYGVDFDYATSPAASVVSVVEGQQDSFLLSERKKNNEEKSDSESPSCKLWVAPSSIPNAGFGIYTTETLQEGEDINDYGGTTIAVVSPSGLDIVQSPHIQRFHSIWWGVYGGMSDHMRYEAANVYGFNVNLGALPNYHPYLHNFDTRQHALVYDDTMADRNTDPTAGSFSYYTGKSYYATTKRVLAGSELFLDYGDSFFENNKGKSKQMARFADYELIGKILAQNERLQKSLTKGKEARVEIESILAAIRKELIESSLRHPKRILALLPKDYDQLHLVMGNYANRSEGESPTNEDISESIALHMSTTPRTVEWIRANGKCLDNVGPGESTISGNVGKGAIARRTIRKGGLVVPVPLVHIPNQHDLSYFHVRDENNERVVVEMTKSKLPQLLFNYCFGHTESTLALCPETNAILINHCSSRSNNSTHPCGGDGPNAAYRWAIEWDPSTGVNLKKSFDEISKMEAHHIVSLEIVALRDILPGEEVFIDYGVAWEEAWERHVATWKPPSDDSVFAVHQSEVEMNSRDHINEFRSLREEGAPSYGSLFTMCWYEDFRNETEQEKSNSGDASEKNKNGNFEDENDDGFDDYDDEYYGEARRSNNDEWNWKNLSDDEILRRFASDGSTFAVPDSHAGGEFWPCSVIAREEEDVNEGSRYMVRIFPSPFHERPEWNKKGKPRILLHYNRRSIRYFTKQLRSDQYLPNAFRHHIEIPDKMFPQQWKNLRKTRHIRSRLLVDSTT